MSLIRTCEEKDRYLCDDFKVESGKTLMEIVHTAMYSRRKYSRKYDKPYITDLFKEIPLTQDDINEVFQNCIDYAKCEHDLCGYIYELKDLIRDRYPMCMTDEGHKKYEEREKLIQSLPDTPQNLLSKCRDLLHETDSLFEEKMLYIFLKAFSEMSEEEKHKLTQMKHWELAMIDLAKE